MFEQTTHNEPQPAGLDRRSVLKKAALAGTIAWTAPLIVSSPALAGACTPACAPQNVAALQVLSRDACANEITALASVTGNANKIVFVKIVAPSATCPCGTALPSVSLSGLPTSFSKGNDPGTGACDPFKASPSNPEVGVVPGTTLPNEFIVYKNGAMPNGWYTGNSDICVSVKCLDQVGSDPVYTKCKYRLCFEYSPAGSCSSFDDYGFKLTPVGTCVTGCTSSC